MTGRSCQRRINQVASTYLSLYRTQRQRRVVGDQQYWQVLYTPLLPVTGIPVCHPLPTRKAGWLGASVLLQSLDT